MNGQSRKGSYVLLIRLSKTSRIAVGRLGEIYFPAGWYAYVGSAMRGFNSRIPHHLRKNKKLRWHIDYLLQAASLERIITFENEVRMECSIAEELLEGLEYIPGFGCSDCRCKSHLFYSKSDIPPLVHCLIDTRRHSSYHIIYGGDHSLSQSL